MMRIEYKRCTCGGKVKKLTTDLVMCEKCFKRYWTYKMVKVNKRKGEKVNV